MPLEEGERGELKKTGLKLSIEKTKIMASGPITSWQTDEGKVETVRDFIFLGSKITVDSDWSHKIKKHLLLGRKAMTNLVKVKVEKKVGLKLNIQKIKIIASGPITSWQIDGETVEIVTDFILGGLQNPCRW